MKHDKGFTLVELMIGLLLSSILMIAMLTLFKQTNFIGLNSAEDSEYEAQLEIGMLTIQRLVGNAGYGTGQDSDVILGLYEGKQALFWRYADDHEADPMNMICRGFGVKIESSKHHLLLLEGSFPCTTSNLADVAWSVKQPIATIKSTSTSPVFTYDLVSGECLPYGIHQGGFTGNKRVVIKGTRNPAYGFDPVSDAEIINKKRIVCFNNIKTP